MNTAILPSTLFLTLLLAVGLFFFIRASVKERLQQVRLVSGQPEPALIAQLQQYFQARSYQVTSSNAQQHQVTFEGIVRPSVFLAIFLTLLAAVGSMCLVLVVSLLFPRPSIFLFALVLMSPIAGIFYWKKAGRKERVSLKLEAIDSEKTQPQSQITVIAHRDELLELQKALNLKVVEAE